MESSDNYVVFSAVINMDVCDEEYILIAISFVGYDSERDILSMNNSIRLIQDMMREQ